MLLLDCMICHSKSASGPAPQAVTKNKEVEQLGPFVVGFPCMCYFWNVIAMPMHSWLHPFRPRVAVLLRLSSVLHVQLITIDLGFKVGFDPKH